MNMHSKEYHEVIGGDSLPLHSANHPPFSAIALQGFIEREFPDTPPEQMLAKILALQNLYHAIEGSKPKEHSIDQFGNCNMGCC